MKLFTFFTATMISLASTTAFAGASYYENAQMHCLIFEDGKVQKQTDCQASGMEYGGAGYGGGIDWTFGEIKGFGVFVVSRGLVFANDQAGDMLMDENGYAKIDRQWLTLNDKPAVMFHRFKNHQRFTAQQEELYRTNKLLDTKGDVISPYHCLAQTQNPKLEFCFNGKF